MFGWCLTLGSKESVFDCQSLAVAFANIYHAVVVQCRMCMCCCAEHGVVGLHAAGNYNASAHHTIFVSVSLALHAEDLLQIITECMSQVSYHTTSASCLCAIYI
jgi:hypothetical protein